MNVSIYLEQRSFYKLSVFYVKRHLMSTSMRQTMTQTTQSTQATYDATSRRIEKQHAELLRKLDELDKRIELVLAEWGSNANVLSAGSSFTLR